MEEVNQKFASALRVVVVTVVILFVALHIAVLRNAYAHNLTAVQRQHIKEAEAEVRDIKCAIRTECHTCWKRKTSRDCLDGSSGV